MNTMSGNRKSVAGLLLSVIIGLLIGSFLSQVFGLLPDNVVKEFFTKSVTFGFGFDPDGIVIDLSALRFKFGFTCEFTFLSFVGMATAVYIFRWYT